jgi:type IV pilus assembly protein PilO
MSLVEDLQKLDVNNIGAWPPPAKIAVWVLIFLLLVGAGWYFDIQDQRVSLQEAEAKETELKNTFETKQRKTANLDALKQQMVEMQETFGEMLKRLPDRTQVDALLVDISQQGLAAGLEFELFKPGQEQPAEFYVELPIQIRVTGDYHQFGEFVSGVADLPRIVTQHDIQIKEGAGKGQLVMESTAKTYRYLGEEEAKTGAKK